MKRVEVAYAALRCPGSNEACWGGVRIHGGCVCLLERSIRLLGLVWAFGLWFGLWAYSKPSSQAHYSNLFSIDKIVFWILVDTKWDVYSCPSFGIIAFSDECQKTEKTPVLSNQDPGIHKLTLLANKCMQWDLACDSGIICRRNDVSVPVGLRHKVRWMQWFLKMWSEPWGCLRTFRRRIRSKRSSNASLLKEAEFVSVAIGLRHKVRWMQWFL